MKERDLHYVVPLPWVDPEIPPSASSRQPTSSNAIMKCRPTSLFILCRVQYVRKNCQNQYLESFKCLQEQDDQGSMHNIKKYFTSGTIDEKMC